MDRVAREIRSANMRAIRSKGMKPEMAVRRMVHAMGYRFRLHRKDLPGKPDLVFPARRKVIFVHGCFWHQHPDPSCKIAHRPRSNREYWLPKLERNVRRDADNRTQLQQLEWGVLIVWECEIREADRLRDRMKEFLDAARD